MEGIVEKFFSKEYEEKINKGILFYSFPQEEVQTYVEQVISEPLPRFITYIDKLSERTKIEAGDVFQFSDFQNRL